MKLLFASAIVAAALVLEGWHWPTVAAPGWQDRVPDVCDGVPTAHDECASWIGSLWSDNGRCCDTADAIDAMWRASKTAESGYAVNYGGDWYDVGAKAAHMKVGLGQRTFHDVTDNKAGKTLLWLTFVLDNGTLSVKRPNQTDEHQIASVEVRCFLPGGAY